jgi:hypothetical protein
LALIGVWRWRNIARPPGSRVLAAWLLSAGLFFVLGQLTPIDVRYYLWAAPCVAILAAMATSPDDGKLASRLFDAAGVVAVALGTRYWLSWLG